MATTQDVLQTTSIVPSFTVDDLQKSIAFYEGLGFSVEERWEESGTLLGVMLRAGEHRIGLSQDDWKKGRDRKKGVGMRVFIGTSHNIDEIAARAKGAGIRLDTEPHDTEWKSRAFEVTDPSGFLLTVSKRIAITVRLPSASAALARQPERGHLLAVANQQDIADEYRVVPGLAVEYLESGELRELIWHRADQSQLTFFRQHQQQVLFGQEHELTVAVTSTLPLARAVLQVDAREDAAIEAKGVALVNDEVVEVGLQPARCPALIDAPALRVRVRPRGGGCQPRPSCRQRR